MIDEAKKEITIFQNIGHALGAELSQMFGKPCFKANGKAFIGFFQNEMVFKFTNPALGEAVNLRGAKLFDPSGKGRPMREWVQLPAIHSDQWEYFAKSALEYVGKGESECRDH